MLNISNRFLLPECELQICDCLGECLANRAVTITVEVDKKSTTPAYLNIEQSRYIEKRE